MTNYVYALSDDEEYWTHSDPSEVIESTDIYDMEVGDIITIYQGEGVPLKASSLLPDLGEAMSEQAYAEIGEAAENWVPDFCAFQKEVAELACKHFGMLPCWQVINVKPFKYEVVATCEEGGQVTEVRAVV